MNASLFISTSSIFPSSSNLNSWVSSILDPAGYFCFDSKLRTTLLVNANDSKFFVWHPIFDFFFSSSSVCKKICKLVFNVPFFYPYLLQLLIDPILIRHFSTMTMVLCCWPTCICLSKPKLWYNLPRRQDRIFQASNCAIHEITPGCGRRVALRHHDVNRFTSLQLDLHKLYLHQLIQVA